MERYVSLPMAVHPLQSLLDIHRLCIPEWWICSKSVFPDVGSRAKTVGRELRETVSVDNGRRRGKKNVGCHRQRRVRQHSSMMWQ